jgi:hypothetical protein
MNAFDSAHREETYKPYYHLFGFKGEGPITKGVGGKFPHHRGLFIGWNQLQFEGKKFDFWHCKGVNRLHRTYLGAEETLGGTSATLANITEWPTADGVVVIREKQKVMVKRVSEKRLEMDFAFELSAPSGEVFLGGDAQHAGFHFRAAESVEKTLATYVRPEGAVDKKNDIWDCPWVAATFEVADAKYQVAHMSHPSNPATVYSTRNYGRFGAFSTAKVTKESPLNLRYRVILIDGAEPKDTAAWTAEYKAWAAQP